MPSAAASIPIAAQRCPECTAQNTPGRVPATFRDGRISARPTLGRRRHADHVGRAHAAAPAGMPGRRARAVPKPDSASDLEGGLVRLADEAAESQLQSYDSASGWLALPCSRLSRHQPERRPTPMTPTQRSQEIGQHGPAADDEDSKASLVMTKRQSGDAEYGQQNGKAPANKGASLVPTQPDQAARPCSGSLITVMTSPVFAVLKVPGRLQLSLTAADAKPRAHRCGSLIRFRLCSPPGQAGQGRSLRSRLR